MVHSLLQVCLLTVTMGVGAKASTPIKLSRHEQKQQRQVLEENNESNSFQYIMGVPTPTYQTNLDTSTPTGYNWSYGSQTIINDVLRLTNYTYTFCGPLADISSENNIYWGLQAYEVGGCYKADVWTIEPQMLTYNNDFVKNVKLNLVTTGDYPVKFNVKLEFYQSTDPAFEEVCEWSTYEYHVDTINNLLHNGNLRNYQRTVQTYEYTTTPNNDSDSYHTFGFNMNIVQGVTNYYALLYTIENIEFDSEQYNPLLDAINSTLNGAYCTVFDSSATVIQGIWTPAVVTQEVINVPALLWEILGMPFAFISTAFNLTLFPGTPYQINFSNLILTIFGVLVFIFIVGLIAKRR